MKKIAFVLYRDWAFDIFKEVQSAVENGAFSQVTIPLLVTTPEREFELPTNSKYEVKIIAGKDQAALQEALLGCDIDTVCFYGWSWIVKEPVLSDYTCLCLHPSPLPRYRGGSPIQNQIVAGETTSAVSIIKMSEGIDDGDIYTQVPISLTGYLPNILNEIVSAGVIGTKKYLADLVQGLVVFTPQVGLEENPPLRRRHPEDGEIDLVAVSNALYEQVYNLVRGLQKPYPNAYIKTKSGILYIEKIEFSAVVPSDSTTINEDSATITKLPVAFNVKGGFAVVTSGRFEATEK